MRKTLIISGTKTNKVKYTKTAWVIIFQEMLPKQGVHTMVNDVEILGIIFH